MKPCLLIVVHWKSKKQPSISDVLTNPAYNSHLKEFLEGAEKKDVKKKMKQFIKLYQEEEVIEQAFVSDNKNHKRILEATLVIDVDSKSYLKNRMPDKLGQDYIEHYLEKYEDYISKFKSL